MNYRLFRDNKRIIEITSLAFAANIISPIILTLFNYYPYPAFFSDETDTHKDYYHICHFTLNKISSYGAWKNIYPPFGHFYCIVMRPFFSQMYNSPHTAQFSPVDAATYYFLALTATASILLLGCVYMNRFQCSRGYFFSFCCMSASPQLMALDRGNLMLLAQIFTNLFFAALVLKPTRVVKLTVYICSGVAAGMKPYMLFPLLLNPATAFFASLSAVGWNIISYILWQPPGIELWLRNIKEFTDASGLFPSYGLLTADMAAWTSFRYQITLLLKAMNVNPEILRPNILVYSLIVLSTIIYALFISLSMYMLIRSLLLQVQRIGLSAWLTHLPFAKRFENTDYGLVPAKDSLLLPFCSTYLILFAFMPLLTKGIYWYALIFFLPALLLSDLILYNSSNLFTSTFCWIYQLTKIAVLTTLIYPDYTRDCWSPTYPPAANYLGDQIRAWSGIHFLIPTENIVPHCPISNGLLIGSLIIRTMLLPFMSCLAASVLLRVYTRARLVAKKS